MPRFKSQMQFLLGGEERAGWHHAWMGWWRTSRMGPFRSVAWTQIDMNALPNAEVGQRLFEFSRHACGEAGIHADREVDADSHILP